MAWNAGVSTYVCFFLSQTNSAIMALDCFFLGMELEQFFIGISPVIQLFSAP